MWGWQIRWLLLWGAIILVTFSNVAEVQTSATAILLAVADLGIFTLGLLSTVMNSSNRQVYLKRITTCHSEKMHMHREHCPDEPVLVNCAQVSQRCKSSMKQDITVQSPDVMVSVWQSLAVSDLITPSICCSSAKSMAHEVYGHVFNFVLSISCTQDILQLYHMCDLTRCWFRSIWPNLQSLLFLADICKCYSSLVLIWGMQFQALCSVQHFTIY